VHRLLLASPVGALLAEYAPEGVRALRFQPPGAHPPAGTRAAPTRGDAVGRQVARELEEYFAGARREFTLPLAPAGTEFQRAVWAALRRIPYGETRSYGQLAAGLGRPHASRAVGQANARNPLPIVVPCHRVLAAGGGLGGYLGDWEEGRGVAIKQYLLGLEGVRVR
jgi:methylated-DNA-[protein]-cysteine S-methyltransferase